jgi:TnpA family transposase
VTEAAGTTTPSSKPGEALHTLRCFLSFGNWERLRKGQLEEHTVQAHALTRVTDAAIVWNTVYITTVLNSCGRKGTRYTTRMWRPSRPRAMSTLSA